MVASSIASKGLDFSEIQHVINFSMPKEIEVRSRSCFPALHQVLTTEVIICRTTCIKLDVPVVQARRESRRPSSTCKPLSRRSWISSTSSWRPNKSESSVPLLLSLPFPDDASHFQRIPPFLASIEDPNVGTDGVVACTNCGGELYFRADSLSEKCLIPLFSNPGLGHRITNCPKLEENQRRTVAGHMGGRDTGGY